MCQSDLMIYDDEGKTVITITDLEKMSTDEFKSLVKDLLSDEEYETLYNTPFTGIVVAEDEESQDWFSHLKNKVMTIDEWIESVKSWVDGYLCTEFANW